MKFETIEMKWKNKHLLYKTQIVEKLLSKTKSSPKELPMLIPLEVFGKTKRKFILLMNNIAR
jgi:hypothetical protein